MLHLQMRWGDLHRVSAEKHGREGWPCGYYGKVIGENIQKKLGHFYPSVRLPNEQGSEDAQAVAWI